MLLLDHFSKHYRWFNEILNFNNIFLNLYFVTLQPIEFTELDNISTKVRKEEETGEKQAENLSSQELKISLMKMVKTYTLN